MQVEKISNDYNAINGNTVVTEVNLTDNVQESLRNIILKEGYTSYNVFKRMISANGSNYLGDIYEVDVTGETKDGRKEINIFLKQVITGDGMKNLVDIDACYSNEIFFYTELKTVFNALQDAVDIPEDERFKMVKSYNESDSDAIILENLTKRGFRTLHRMDVMDLKFAELSVTQLAKYHGVSFVLKYKNKEYFDKKIKTIESAMKFDDPWKVLLKRVYNDATAHFDSDTRKKINKFRHTAYEKFPSYFSGNVKSIKCLCHGDFRINNIMIKDNDEENTEVIVVDYQFPIYGSPIMDLLYFIYTGTDRKFRNAHLSNLKDLYHRKLTEFLKYFDLDVNNVYPEEVFKNDFEQFLDFGLMIALGISPIIFTTEEKLPDFGNETVESMSFKLDDRCKDRITEIVDEYLEWGILK